MNQDTIEEDFLPDSKPSASMDKVRSKPSPFSILPFWHHLVPITGVTYEETHNYFGALTPELIIKAASLFLASHSDAKASDAADTLTNFLQITLGDYLNEKGLEKSEKMSLGTWFTIRMTTPCLEYGDMPRWHRDALMFHCDVPGDVNSKYAVTLLGNPTKVLAESELVRDVVTGRHSERREEYAERLPLELCHDIERGDIIRFSWGQVDSPVHSEPDMSCDRVFVSILYGSEREIRNMCEIRDSKYEE
jgi:hypothetical protein